MADRIPINIAEWMRWVESQLNMILANGVTYDVPVGVYVDGTLLNSAAEPPPGYEWADGGLLDRDEFDDLFAIIGTTFGVGDGVTTFQKPTRAHFLIRV